MYTVCVQKAKYVLASTLSSALPFCAVHSISLLHSEKINGKINTKRLCEISGSHRHLLHICNILGCCATLVC